MSVWSLLFPSADERRRKADEEAELRSYHESRVNNEQAVRSGTRLMKTYAGAMSMMARGENEDR